MRNATRPRGIAIILIVVLLASLVAGCASEREKEPEAPKSPFLLPRLTVSIDEQGVPSVLGLSLATVSKLLGRDVSAFSAPPELVQQLMAAGVQHLEVVVSGDGVFLFANGQPLPYLAADTQSWQSLDELATVLNVSNWKTIKWVLDNVVRRFGVPLVLKFPIAEGAAELPLRDNKTLPQVDVEAVRSSTGQPDLRLHADVAVDAQGVPTIAGMSLTDLQQSLQGVGAAVDLSSARLDPATVASLMGASVQHLQIETEPEGLYAYVNGKRLPRVSWDDARLANAAALYSRLEPDSPYVPLIDFLLPYIQPADVELTLMLPKQAGAAEVAPSPFISGQ